jgi:Ca-activated chloride channel family protein
MPTNTISLTASSDRQLVAVEVSSQRTVEWLVEASAAASTHRASLNIALVLDRSGSMANGKLAYVQQAACHLLDALDERDRLAVVAYDDQVTLLAAAGPLTAARHAEIKAAVNALRPGGTTNLSGGWLEGCRAVAEHLEAGGVNRALLLTDGLANRGITDVEELALHAGELRARGVATSTFGVGLDFNEQLLTLLAERGGGHFYYIERPQQIPEVFRTELSELLAVVAREAVLQISVPRGVAVEVLGDLPHEREGERLRVFLGDMAAGEVRRIYTRVLTPPDAPGTSVVLHGAVEFADLEGRADKAATEIGFSYVREAEALLAPIIADILTRASEVELATAAARALALERTGQREQAHAALRYALAAHASYAPAPAAAVYDELAARMQHGLSEADRKQTQFAAYKKRQNRDR